MNPLQDLSQLDALVAPYRRLCSNGILLPDGIRDGGLFYEENPSGLFLYQDYGPAYRLFFYLDPKEPLSLTPKDKPVLAAFLGMGESISPKFQAAAACLTAGGFAPGPPARHMTRNLSGASFDEPKHPVVFAGTEHADDILKLWHSAFDPVRQMLPIWDTLVALLAARRILCVPGRNGRLLGVLYAHMERGSAQIKHEVVSPEGRGQGIGRALSQAFFRLAQAQSVPRATLWVENEHAAAFHQACGFAYDGRVWYPYILRASSDSLDGTL